MTTPVSATLLQYSPPTAGTAGTKSLDCDQDFGTGLVKRWRDTREEYCKPVGAPVKTGAQPKAGGSRIECLFVKQSEHGGDGDNLWS